MALPTAKQFVLITHDPHYTPHFWQVANELFRGTFIECERFEQDNNITGYFWAAKQWDAKP